MHYSFIFIISSDVHKPHPVIFWGGAFIIFFTSITSQGLTEHIHPIQSFMASQLYQGPLRDES